MPLNFEVTTIESRLAGWGMSVIFDDLHPPVEGQINCHVCASYCHDEICHYPGLEPGFFFLDQCLIGSLVVSSKRRM